MQFRIRRFTHSDLLPLYNLLSDPQVMRFLESPYTLKRTQDFLQTAGLNDSPLIYAVDNNDGVFIGYVIYHDYELDSKEIGWVLRPEFWCKGYATALTNKLIMWAQNENKAVIIECVPEQIATMRIAKKFGFLYVGKNNNLEVFRLDKLIK